MAARPSRDAEKRIAEHKRRLKEDSRYLEDFLEKTAIPKETSRIICDLKTMYALYGCENDLPDQNSLIAIIDLAHADTQASVRSRVTGEHTFASTEHPNPGIEDEGYYLLRDLPAQYLLSKERTDIPALTAEEAMQMAQSGSRLEGYKVILAVGIEGLKRDEGFLDRMRLGAAMAISLFSATWYAASPMRHRAKMLMQGRTYEEMPEGRRHFERIKSRIDDVFTHYQK